MKFYDFVDKRWKELQQALNLQDCTCTFEIRDGYPHFKKKRGYAVCFNYSPTACHLQFAPKILEAPMHRVDGLVRHELGHVADFMIKPDVLNKIARGHGLILPSTPERRADAIALLLWGDELKYDSDLVQSTKVGVTPRPKHLGL